ncbi:hypothetical protein KKC17_03785 [Patescibacteria group bacterium]|nr:hypothetical protein [Patescibacteria group bacterium]
MKKIHLIFVVILVIFLYYLARSVEVAAHTSFCLIGIIAAITGVMKDEEKKLANGINYLVAAFISFTIGLITSIQHSINFGVGLNILVAVVCLIGFLLSLMVYSDNTDEHRLDLKKRHPKLFGLTMLFGLIYFGGLALKLFQ